MKNMLLIFILIVVPIEVTAKIVQQINPNGTITYINVHEAPPKIVEKEDPNVGDVIDDIRIYSISTKFIKKSSSYVYVGLKVKVKNLSDDQDVSVKVVCLDKDGFELDDTYASGNIRPGRTGYLTNQIMLDEAIYPKVKEWIVK